MKIKKILISQPKPENGKSPYNNLAENNNLQIDFKQFIHVEPVPCREFRQCRIEILDHTAVIFNSKNSVDHFFRICEEMRITVPDSMKYFCKSEATAFYLQKYIVYRKRKIFYANGCFDDLLNIILKHRGEKYLVPLSDSHNNFIPKTLRKHKIKFTKAVIYRTVCSDLSDISAMDYDVLVFFSPSGIKSLIKNFPGFKQNNIKIASFGTFTAKAVRESGLRLDLEAPQPDVPSMAMALEKFIVEQNRNH